ncbi:MAG: hypothetical protein WCF63_03245 [Acidimicrobiales bacterium]|jgi:hypothetical protein
MTDATSNASIVVRAALLKIDPAHVLRVVDSLDLRAHAKVSAVVGVPLRQFQQRRDVEAFVTSAPMAAARALLEVIAVAPLEKVIELLGDHAEHPTYEELSAAIDQFLDGGGSSDDALSVLAYAIGEAFPAAAQCRRLISERAEFALPEVPEGHAATVLATPREVSPEIREQRKQRREEEKRRKKVATPPRAPRSAKPKNSAPPRPSANVSPPTPSEPESRRRVLLTPLEESRFDADHPLAGSVVVVDVPFDAIDPLQPDVASKERPALVVAASSNELLVRPLYSQVSPARSIFAPWRRVGLDHVSYIDDARLAVALGSEPLRPLAQLTTAEWNALF